MNCHTFEFMSAKTKSEFLQDVVNSYKEAHGPNWHTDRRTIAAWALRNRKVVPEESEIIDLIAEEISQAMRTEHFIDPQGRKVRKKYPIRKKVETAWGVWRQTYIWADIEDAGPEHMKLHFSQRRRQILGDCVQAKRDLDSYNENYNLGPPLQMNFDFSEDLAEMSAPDTHPDIDEDFEDEDERI